MEDNAKMIESLYERAMDYGKTSFDLVKYKTLDKSSNVASSVIPHSITFLLIASFLIFFNLGIAFWLGEILGTVFYGFFVVAAFYGILGIFVHVVMHKWLKKNINNYIIKMALK